MKIEINVGEEERLSPGNFADTLITQRLNRAHNEKIWSCEVSWLEEVAEHILIAVKHIRKEHKK